MYIHIAYTDICVCIYIYNIYIILINLYELHKFKIDTKSFTIICHKKTRKEKFIKKF